MSPQSPCISVCTLDEDNICVGCFRTLDEVIDWTMLDDNAKQEVLDNVAVRAVGREQYGS